MSHQHVLNWQSHGESKTLVDVHRGFGPDFACSWDIHPMKHSHCLGPGESRALLDRSLDKPADRTGTWSLLIQLG